MSHQARVYDLTVAVGISLEVLQQRARKSVRQGSVDPDRTPSEIADRMVDILMDPARRHAMQAMLERAVPRDEETEQIDWEKVELLLEDYGRVEVPCLFLWGQWDEVLPSTSGDTFVNDVPGSRLRVIRRCRHSIPSEQAELSATMIDRFINEGIDSWRKKEKVEQLPTTGPTMPNERGTVQGAKKEVSSRLTEQPVPSAPSTVSVLSGRDVERSGARYLSDSLRMLPGVEVQRLSSTESGVAFRGWLDTSTAAQGVLGLLDGRQVYNQFLGNVLWDQLPIRLEDVDRIEIIRGPASFIHGPNAMHGVVNIRMKEPLDYDRGAVSVIAHAGSYESRVVGTSAVHRTDNTGFKMSAQWDDIGQFDGEREDTRDKAFFDAAFQVKLDGNENHVLGLGAGYSDQKFDLLLPKVEVIPSTIAVSDAREMFARIDYRWAKPGQVEMKARASWSSMDATAAPIDYYETFDLDLDTWDLDAQLDYQAVEHRITGGAGYRFSSVDTRGRDVTDGRHSVNQFWLFAQDEWDITERLALTFGARLDLHSETGSAVSPRVAAVFQFVDHHFFRASAGRGFRNPSLRELWFDMQVTDVPGVPVPVTISGNNDLDAESLTSFELGYFGSWGPLVDAEPGKIIATDPDSETHQFEAGITGFYNIIDDLISYQTDPDDPLNVLPVNQADEEVLGFEVEGRYVFSDRFSALANYSYAVRRDRDSGERTEFQSPQTANAGVAWSGSRISAMLWLNYYGRSKFDGIDLDDYFLLNGSVSYRFPVATRSHGQVFIRFFNVIGDEHREHPQGDKYGRILTGGLQFDW